jgi:hypothetical protein
VSRIGEPVRGDLQPRRRGQQQAADGADTGNDLRLLAVNATPAYVRGAYRLFGGRFTTGGSVYTVNLDAVDSIPAGARLTMTFGHPSTGLSCASIGGISFITIFQTGSVRPGSYSCNEARALAFAWVARFRAHLSVRTVRAGGITFACRLVATAATEHRVQRRQPAGALLGPDRLRQHREAF